MSINESVISEHYEREEKTVSMLKANLGAVILTVPVALICFSFYSFFYGTPNILQNGIFGYYYGLMEVTGYFVVFTVLHELIHGFIWHFYCDGGWKSIRFGFIVRLLTPYCHCKEPLLVRQYRRGTIAPLLLTGILPYIISLLLGSTILMFASLLMIVGAGGDMLILLLLSRAQPDELVQDHPRMCGCILYRLKPAV